MALRRHLLALTAAGLAAPAILRAQTAPSQPSAAIPDAMMADGRFASFIVLLERGTGMNLLRSAGQFTVFAPTDAGVDSIPANLRSELIGTPTNSNSSGGGNQGALAALVNLHIVDGIHPAAGFTQPSTLLRSRNGTGLKVTRTARNTLEVTLADQEGPGVGGLNLPRPATILTPGVTAANGIILPINVALLK